MRLIVKPESFYTELALYKDKKYESRGKPYKYAHTQLLKCQNGLCAYTEFSLNAGCDVDHWNPDLKNTDGYNPDNLFLVNKAINQNIKGRQHPKILKPDGNTIEYGYYPPEQLISYDLKNHVYYAKDTQFKEIVKQDLEILGVNAVNVVTERREKLSKFLYRIKLGYECKEPDFKDFPTAVKFFLTDYIK